LGGVWYRDEIVASWFTWSWGRGGYILDSGSEAHRGDEICYGGRGSGWGRRMVLDSALCLIGIVACGKGVSEEGRKEKGADLCRRAACKGPA
jgi:hypothetical protein